MKLSAEQLQANWDRLMTAIDVYISGERREALKAMYKELEEQIIFLPASGKPHFHNAFVGGYVEHVLRVLELAIKTKKFWEASGADINFTDEELAFAAINHDLGKIGDTNQPGYIEQTDEWRKNKLQEYFTNNKELPFMLMQDRSLYLLQKYGVSMTENEYLAIRLHDGIYDEANKAYFISYNPDSKFRTNIVYILHQADFMASKIEYDRWATSKKPASTTKKSGGYKKGPATPTMSGDVSGIKDAFKTFD
jgi:hypothetical protein